MDTSVQGLGHLVSEPEIGLQQDLDNNQDDDFDFEIGGDDAFELTGGAGIENTDYVQHGDGAETHDTPDQSYVHQLHEQDAQASFTDQYDSMSVEHDQQATDVAPFGLDNLTETGEETQDAQADAQTNRDVTAQEELNIDDGAPDNIYYDQTVGDTEFLDETVRPEPRQDHDLMFATTSVSYTQEGDGPLDSGYEARENDVEHALIDDSGSGQSHFAEEETSERLQSAEIAAEHENSNHGGDAQIAADVEEVEAGGGGGPGAELFVDDAPADANATSLDQSNWDPHEGEDEDDDGDQIPAGPTVTVSYLGQEYSMFAQSPDDDPETYFLDEADSIYQPLSQFLEVLRQVVSSELEEGQELFVRIDGLGLEFGESTTKTFLDNTTLAQIIEVNDKLSQHDGGSQHAELYIFLSIQSDPLHRFNELVKGAEDGQGLSHFEQYYEPSGDVSELFDEEEEYGASLSDEPDDDDLEKPFSGLEEVAHGTGDSLDTQQYSNPFRVTDPQQPSSGSNPFTAPGNDFRENETGHFGNFDNHLAEDTSEAADVVHDDHYGVEAAAADSQVIFDEADHGDAISLTEQPEVGDSAEYWASERGVDALSGQDGLELGEATEEQAEVLIDKSEDGHDRTDGENFFYLHGNGCLAPNFCVCESCYDFGLGFETHVDQSSDPVHSSPAHLDPSNAFTDAEWDVIMAVSPKQDSIATDMQTQDNEANIANDEDYLDLGNDGGDRLQFTAATATHNNLTEQLDIQRQITPNSSATGTLNGEDIGHEDEAAVGNLMTADPNHAHNAATDSENVQIDDDEIDWNHDEDDEIDTAGQNPTSLSPSSLSTKRSRLEEEAIDGLGDDTGMFEFPGGSQSHANCLPAAKRRRLET